MDFKIKTLVFNPLKPIWEIQKFGNLIDFYYDKGF